jgi:hypothetical protein
MTLKSLVYPLPDGRGSDRSGNKWNGAATVREWIGARRFLPGLTLKGPDFF